jgi:hypothetical protein
MQTSEILLSLSPNLILIALAVVILKKSGVFQQQAHRARVEKLLERIAVAVEKNQK